MPRTPPRPKRTGQPKRPTPTEVGFTALTPELTIAIVKGVKTGAHPSTAAQARGISRTTFNRWMAQGADRYELDDLGNETLILGQEPFRTLRVAVQRAEAEVEEDLASRYRQVSRQAAFGNANYMSGFLTKRWPERWREGQSLELSGPQGGPIEVQGDDHAWVRQLIAAATEVGLDRLGGTAASPDAEDDPLHPQDGHEAEP